MIYNSYAKAYTEVLEIIKYFPEEEYNKIPKEKIEFYKENMDKNYEFKINPELDLSKQNISIKANAIIVTLFQNYFATEEQNKKINEILKMNEIKSEQEKREKYNPEDMFKDNTEIKQKDTTQTALIESKDNFFVKIKRFIMKYIKK